MHEKSAEAGYAALLAYREHEKLLEGEEQVAEMLRVGRLALLYATLDEQTAATEDGRLAPWTGETDIFITPGHRFRLCDGLMTNFHQPRSTLMMLVAAFMGLERIRRIYAHAVAERYRFHSYGDSSLLLPGG